MKVFIADDSILIRNIVKELLSTDPSISIIGEAANGEDAVNRVAGLKPDIVIMDIDMPIMNGLEATALITKASSIPVLVFTHNTDPELPFRALERGAVDFLLKPDFSDLNKPEYVSKFISRLRVLSNRRVLPSAQSGAKPGGDESRPLGSRVNVPAKNMEPGRRSGPAPESSGESPEEAAFPLQHPRVSVIVVGASTGGPQAVAKFLSGIKTPFPLPVMIVQHIETGFDKGYADWLSDETGHKVILAQAGAKPLAGFVYVAPTDLHLKFSDSGFVLEDGVKVLNQKPSVDVLFRSAAEQYGSQVLGVLLTGMGTDGAEGCASIQAKGGFTVVQDESSSLIFGMPKAAIARGAASLVLPLHRIGAFVSAITESYQ